MLGRNVRLAARQQDRVGHLEHGTDIGHAGAKRNEKRLTFGHFGYGRRVLAPHGGKDVIFDQLGARRYDDNRSAHAASSPATSFSVRSSALAITASASSNWACVQISGRGIPIVSSAARVIIPFMTQRSQ